MGVNAAVIVAAGRGERAREGGAGPKQYRRIGGQAVLRHTIEAFASHPAIGPIVIAIHPDDEELFAGAVGELHGRVRTVHGDKSRQSSTLAALEALASDRPDRVLIHDGVRPFVDADLISRVLDGIAAETAAIPAIPISDTLKRTDKTGRIIETVPREHLFAAQTPQGFPYRMILDAHRAAAAEGLGDVFTDDAAIAEWRGFPVRIVEGAAGNAKITWPQDIALAEGRLRAMDQSFPDIRVGIGYDVHALEPGDAVTLCGVRIAHDRALSGHSDADVGLHALTDALLGSFGGGDIGTHFPPSEPRWKGAPSRLFLEHAARLVRERGGRIANADISLLCERPKIGPHRTAMVAKIAAILQIEPERVSVKATTNERLGFLGREEGIAAIATVCVAYPGGLPP
jgi:2-C-methyl-D-erythritol 4-phosphate cytidylyltransferase/2-C-methyl-D-erythritol 2,4-cyclodiphosphate synthase